MQGTGEFIVSFRPDEVEGLHEEITGKLDLSASGYVYNIPSKSVVWWKFLGLSIYLPIKATLEKCQEFAARRLGEAPNHKRAAEIRHLSKLAEIASKAVFKAGGQSLLERVEEFALAELDHKYGNRKVIMDQHRSTRLRGGNFEAPCMQPLFHKSQYVERMPLKEEMVELIKEKEDLDAVLYYRQNNNSSIFHTVSALFSTYTNPFSEWETEKILAELTYVEGRIQAVQKLLDKAQNCQRYALKAIIGQQSCCSNTNATLKDVLVKTEAEIRCGDDVCYRKQKICGIIDKIECCGTKCWAIDCFCCSCCIWPDARSWCLVA
jgi:hypothetical protein